MDARSPGVARRRVAARSTPPTPVITPLRVTLAVALVIGVALMVVALIVQRGQDVPFLAAACAVLGIALAAYAVTGAISIYRAAADGRGGRAFGLAILGGIAAVGAFGFLALATIFGLLWKGPT
jgi:cation transport ATPase